MTRRVATSVAGQVFGSWTVLSHAVGAEFAEARCVCGTLRTIPARDLRRGHTSRCSGCRQAAADAKVPKVGQRFGSWTVVEVEPRKARRRAFCRCDCGNEGWAYLSSLLHGRTRGCFACGRRKAAAAHVTHGHTKGTRSSTYRCWKGMHTRCGNPNDKSWDHYGGRGIKVCERWGSFPNFLEDMGPRPGPDYWIERYDVDKGYTPENCGWELKEVQPHNRTDTVWVEIEGKRMSLSQACALTGVSVNTAHTRRKRGVEGAALVEPPSPKAARPRPRAVVVEGC